MREFENFLRLFFSVQFTFFLLSLLLLVLFKESGKFILSFSFGYAVMVFDYLMIVKFARSLPEKVLSGERPKSQFWKRFMLIALLLFSLAWFTSIDFFAIILAVAVATLGVVVSAVKFRKEWERWSTGA